MRVIEFQSKDFITEKEAKGTYTKCTVYSVVWVPDKNEWYAAYHLYYFDNSMTSPRVSEYVFGSVLWLEKTYGVYLDIT
jgi:hypothetical protein